LSAGLNPCTPHSGNAIQQLTDGKRQTPAVEEVDRLIGSMKSRINAPAAHAVNID